MKLFSRSCAVLALFVSYCLLLCTYCGPGVEASGATPNFGQRRLLNLSGSSVPSAIGASSVGHRRLLNLSGSSEPSSTASPNTGQRRLLNLSGSFETTTTASSKIGQRRLLNLSGSSEPSSDSPTIGNRRLLNLSGNSNPSTSSPSFGQRKLLDVSGSIEPASLPSILEIGQGYKLTRYVKATGFQEYINAGRGSWTLVNASAELFNFAGEKVGVHYFLPEPDVHGGQPTWELFSPSSLVTGASVVDLTVSPAAIPWLLMQTTRSSGTSSGFGFVKYVQRLFPSDGLPPDPSHPSQIGEVYRSPYTATYAFYVSREFQ